MDEKHLCHICGKNEAQMVQAGYGGSGALVILKCSNCLAISNVSNQTPWYGLELTWKEVEGLFAFAKIEILEEKPLMNGYHHSSRVDEYGQIHYWHPWWFVKTKFGWIEIGWRKCVISIDWKDTCVRATPPSPSFESRTRDETGSHAYSIDEAIKDLTFWHQNAIYMHGR